MKQEFEARLAAKGPKGAWTFLPVPIDITSLFGSRGRIPVSGTMNGFPFRNSLMPEGDGTHSMMVSKELQAGANAKAGDIVQISLQADTEERTVTVPQDLEVALMQSQQASSFFESLSYSHKREYVDWISSAKLEATRTKRVAKAVQMLAEGQKRLR